VHRRNVLETSGESTGEGSAEGESEGEREGKRNKPEATKMTYKKKIVFISHVHKKRKEKSQTELKR